MPSETRVATRRSDDGFEITWKLTGVHVTTTPAGRELSSGRGEGPGRAGGAFHSLQMHSASCLMCLAPEAILTALHDFGCPAMPAQPGTILMIQKNMCYPLESLVFQKKYTKEVQRVK